MIPPSDDFLLKSSRLVEEVIIDVGEIVREFELNESDDVTEWQQSLFRGDQTITHEKLFLWISKDGFEIQSTPVKIL